MMLVLALVLALHPGPTIETPHDYWTHFVPAEDTGMDRYFQWSELEEIRTHGYTLYWNGVLREREEGNWVGSYLFPEDGPDYSKNEELGSQRAVAPVAPSPPPAPPPPHGFGSAVERWHDHVHRWFRGADVHTAMHILDCESNGDPDVVNPRSGTAGLFQHHPAYWEARTAKAGIPGADVFDPDTNVRMAAWLVYENGGWKHWPNCGPGGWKWEIRHGD